MCIQGERGEPDVNPNCIGAKISEKDLCSNHNNSDVKRLIHLLDVALVMTNTLSFNPKFF